MAGSNTAEGTIFLVKIGYIFVMRQTGQTKARMDERRRVERYCENNELNEALSFARAIDCSWNRCQALSTVALRIEDSLTRRRVLDAAFMAAREQSEPNRIVTVAAWPMGVLAIDNDEEELQRNIEWILELISHEQHAVRRLDALMTVLGRIAQGPAKPVLRIADECIAIAENCPSWKKDRSMACAAEWIAPISPQMAQKMVSLIYQPRIRRKALQFLGSGRTTG